MTFEAMARAGALAVVLAVSLTACSSKNERAFVGGCVGMGGSRENCSCAYQQVDATHKVDAIDFGEILGTEQHRRIQVAFAKALVQCIKDNGL
ncbi:MAG: hypothetical protein EON54_04085 [Alcaligenaceae bacterium]|nr:MAG: hypothetical protein EON54_04085 [Alcaligenaceae bacterium]